MTLLTESQRELIRRNWASLTEMMLVRYGLLDHLISRSVITHRQKARIEAEKTESSKVGELLQIILRSTSENFLSLCDALNDTGQAHIVTNMLKGREELDGPTKSANPEMASAAYSRESELRLKVQSNRKRLKEKVEASHLLDGLVLEGFLSETVKQEIKSKPRKEERMQKLLEILLPKGLGAHLSLVRVLKSSGYEYMARAIEQTDINDPTKLAAVSVPASQEVNLTFKMYHQESGSGRSTIKDVPTQVISTFRRNSQRSILKDMEKKYGVTKKTIQKTPLMMTLQPSSGTGLKSLREDIQSGALAKAVMETLSRESYFRGKDTWKVLIQVDYDELGRTIEYYDGSQTEGDQVDMSDMEDDDDTDSSEDDVEGTLGREEADADTDERRLRPCGCIGDGYCVIADFRERSIDEDDPRQKQITKTTMEVATEMVKKHEMVGKTKKYYHSDRDVLAFYQKNRKKTNLATARDKDGFTLLHQCSLENRMETVTALLHAGMLRESYPLKANGERSNYKNMTAVDTAKKLRLTRVVDEIQRCKDIEDSLSWLHRMARIGDVDKMKKIYDRHQELLEKEAPVDKTTPIFWAVISGSLEAVRYLKEKGADVYCRAGNGDTLLTKAAILGHKNLVSFLVRSCNLDPDMSGSDLKAPVVRAIENKDLDTVRELVDSGATVQDSAFPQLATTGDLPMLTYILKKFTLDANFQDRKGKPPIFYAVEQSHVVFTQTLMSKGADIRLLDRRTRCILHAVIEGGSVDLMKLVLDKAKKMGCLGKMINQRDRYLGSDRCFLVRGRDNGLLAFHYVEVDRFFLHTFREITKSGGSLDVAQFGIVIKSGWGAHPAPEIVKEIDDRYDVSRVTPTTPDDMTPLCLAIMKEREELALMLIAAGCDLNTPDMFGLTPLHLAAMRGLVKVVAMLQEKGVDLEAKDNQGRTALAAAEANGHMKVVNFINGQDFFRNQKPKIDEFRNRITEMMKALDDNRFEEIRAEGRNINQYTVSTLRDMTAEINNMFFEMGTAPITEESTVTPDVVQAGTEVSHLPPRLPSSMTSAPSPTSQRAPQPTAPQEHSRAHSYHSPSRDGQDF